jgi:hypothetical protein
MYATEVTRFLAEATPGDWHEPVLDMLSRHGQRSP